ncbi:MAG: serine hydrolase [Candidatus Marinimicrobia bacterium]|nr:serine hydrolase [Candidatus Neomarinimicrobiota bacterium]
MSKLIFPLLFLMACAVAPQPELTSLPLKTYNQSDWNKLTLREKIAQMIMVRIRGDYYHSKHWYRNSLENWLKDDGIGGVISFGGSIHGSYYNVQQFQKWAKYPLLVAADYERGLGQWMGGGTLFPSNMAVAATGDSSLAYDQGRITALEARALGVQVTFSPVMDINNNPANPIINFRSYSDNRETVSKFGSAFIRGAQENGLIACAKHFPGHGNTATDSHTSLPTIKGSRLELESLELYPFRQAVKSGVKMIMVGHIALPGLDDSGDPASHSVAITTDLLRNEMGFDGVIITDGMEMGGLTQMAWAGESAVRAVEAGVDILLLPIDVKHTIDSIEKAVQSGRISENRINESVARIWKMKHEMGLLSGLTQPLFSELESIVGIPEHQKKAREIARKSITLVKDDNYQLPLHPEKIDSLAHIILSLDDGARGYVKSFSTDIIRTHGHVKEMFINDPISELGRKDVLNQINGVDQIVISLVVRIRMDKGIASIDSSHSLLLADLQKTGISMVTFSFGSPYLPAYKMLETYVCAFGYGSVSIKAASDVLWGRSVVNGRLPVNLSPKLPRGFGVKKKKRFKNWGSVNSINFQNAETVLKNAIKSKIFPGAQIAVIQNGSLIYSSGFGHFSYDPDSPQVDGETIYDIASLTKVLAAVPVAMKLISQKKLSLDHTVEQFFPQFTGNGKEDVTIRHLLTHSSGLPGYYQFFLDDKIKTKADVMSYILNVELNVAPGTNFEYSDLGFILLSSIIEKVSGRTLDRLVQSWFFNPIEMKSTRYLPPMDWKLRIAPTELDTLYRNRLIHGEVHDENTYLMGGVSGHAGLFSTAEDIARYAQMLVDGGLWNGKRFFKEEQVQDFTTVQNIPQDSDMALGWDTPSQSGKSIAGDYFTPGSFGHLGFTGTSLWIDPNQEIIIVLLTNRVHPSRKGKEGSKEMYGVRREFYNRIMEVLISTVAE